MDSYAEKQEKRDSSPPKIKVPSSTFEVDRVVLNLLIKYKREYHFDHEDPNSFLREPFTLMANTIKEIVAFSRHDVRSCKALISLIIEPHTKEQFQTYIYRLNGLTPLMSSAEEQEANKSFAKNMSTLENFNQADENYFIRNSLVDLSKLTQGDQRIFFHVMRDSLFNTISQLINKLDHLAERAGHTR